MAGHTPAIPAPLSNPAATHAASLARRAGASRGRSAPALPIGSPAASCPWPPGQRAPERASRADRGFRNIISPKLTFGTTSPYGLSAQPPSPLSEEVRSVRERLSGRKGRNQRILAAVASLLQRSFWQANITFVSAGAPGLLAGAPGCWRGSILGTLA